MLPYLWGLERRQQFLINTLGDIFRTVRLEYNLSEGDMPPLEEFKATLQLLDFRTFPYIDKALVSSLKEILITDIPRIVKHVTGVKAEGAVADTEEDLIDDEEDIDGDSTARSLKKQNSQITLFGYEAHVVVPIVIAILIVVLSALVAIYWDEILELMQYLNELIFNQYRMQSSQSKVTPADEQSGK